MRVRGEWLQQLLLLLLLLVRLGGNVSEGDGALNRLAREDGLVAPVDKDSDVAEAVGHGGEGWCLSVSARGGCKAAAGTRLSRHLQPAAASSLAGRAPHSWAEIWRREDEVGW